MGWLILLRHTRPAGADGLCYGRTDLLPDDDFESVAARLAQQLPAVARIASSPLTRCRLLAARLATARGLPLTIDPALIEMDFGRWEGQPWDALPRAELDAWAADFWHGAPHGGESVAQLHGRVHAALRHWAGSVPVPVPVPVRKGTSNDNAGGGRREGVTRPGDRDAPPTLLVTHAGVIKSAFAAVRTADDFATAPGFGAWCHWPTDPDANATDGMAPQTGAERTRHAAAP